MQYKTVNFRELFLREFEKINGILPNNVPRMCSEDLRIIHSKGFGIGAHTLSHPILAQCSRKSAWNEISSVREIISDLIRGNVDLFAYPNGIPLLDFNNEHIQMVKKAGYKAAVTTQPGVARHGHSLFQLPRFTPWGPRE